MIATTVDPALPATNSADSKPTAPSAVVARKKRGRPTGWRARVFNDLSDLTIEDFAFVRGVVRGDLVFHANHRALTHG